MGMLIHRHRDRHEAVPVGPDKELADLTVAELREYAAEHGVDLGAAKKKAEMVDAIVTAQDRESGTDDDNDAEAEAEAGDSDAGDAGGDEGGDQS